MTHKYVKYKIRSYIRGPLTQILRYVYAIVRHPDVDLEGRCVPQQFDLLQVHQCHVHRDNWRGSQQDHFAGQIRTYGDVKVIVAVHVSRFRDGDTESSYCRRQSRADQSLTILSGNAVSVPVEYVHRTAALFLVGSTHGDVAVAVVINVTQAHHRGPESATNDLTFDRLQFFKIVLNFAQNVIFRELNVLLVFNYEKNNQVY